MGSSPSRPAVGAGPVQVIERLAAVPRRDDLIDEVVTTKSVQNEFDIVQVVFDQQDRLEGTSHLINSFPAWAG